MEETGRAAKTMDLGTEFLLLSLTLFREENTRKGQRKDSDEVGYLSVLLSIPISSHLVRF